jgi:hypothetical protein
MPGAAPPTGKKAGKNIGGIAAVAVIIGFFLPWVSCPGVTLSGAQLASNGASALWAIPVAMLVALAMLLNRGKTLQQRATQAKAAIVSGAASAAVLLYYWSTLSGVGQPDQFGFEAAMRQAFSIEIGAILASLGSIGVMVGGALHLQSPVAMAVPMEPVAELWANEGTGAPSEAGSRDPVRTPVVTPMHSGAAAASAQPAARPRNLGE